VAQPVLLTGSAGTAVDPHFGAWRLPSSPGRLLAWTTLDK